MTLHIGSLAPDFEADSTTGRIRFHAWLGRSWGVLFSHPKDFTPVCTTELGRAAALKTEFVLRDVKILAVSVDRVESHLAWTKDIEDTQGVKLDFPLIDSLQLTDDHKVATPVDWQLGDDVVILPSLQDPAELSRLFPAGFKTVRPYLRITPPPR